MQGMFVTAASHVALFSNINKNTTNYDYELYVAQCYANNIISSVEDMLKNKQYNTNLVNTAKNKIKNLRFLMENNDVKAINCAAEDLCVFREIMEL